MHTQKRRPLTRSASSIASIVILAVLCVTGSFAVGVQTAGDMKAIAPLQAGGTELPGDMNDNGSIDEGDIELILEVVKGYRDPTPAMLRRDPNGDGRLDIDDAMRLVRDLSSL